MIKRRAGSLVIALLILVSCTNTEEQLSKAIDDRDYGSLILIHAHDRRHASEAERQIDILSAEVNTDFLSFLDEAATLPIDQGESIINSHLDDLESLGPIIADLFAEENSKYHPVFLEDIGTLFGRLSRLCKYLDEVISVEDERHEKAVHIYETIAASFPFRSFYDDLYRLYQNDESEDVRNQIRHLYAQSLFLPRNVHPHDSEITRRFLRSWAENDDARVRSDLLDVLYYGQPEIDPSLREDLVEQFLNDSDPDLRERARRMAEVFEEPSPSES